MIKTPGDQWYEPVYLPTGEEEARGLNREIMEELSRSLQLDMEWLHEIEYEDIEIAPVAQEEIRRKVSDMVMQASPSASHPSISSGQMPCRSFWVENTEELILHIWIGEETKTLIVPRGAWTLRRDIRFH